MLQRDPVEDFDLVEDLDDLDLLRALELVPRTSKLSTCPKLSALIVPSSPENLKTFKISRRPRSITKSWEENELIGKMSKGDPASTSSFTRVPLDAISFSEFPAAASLILFVTLWS